MIRPKQVPFDILLGDKGFDDDVVENGQLHTLCPDNLSFSEAKLRAIQKNAQNVNEDESKIDNTALFISHMTIEEHDEKLKRHEHGRKLRDQELKNFWISETKKEFQEYIAEKSAIKEQQDLYWYDGAKLDKKQTMIMGDIYLTQSMMEALGVRNKLEKIDDNEDIYSDTGELRKMKGKKMDPMSLDSHDRWLEK